MNELTRITITSMEAAGWCGKRHTDLLRDIRKYVQQLGESKIAFTDFFKESTYITDQNKTLPCFLVTKKGCEFIAHKMTGQKGTEFTARYINRFHEMEGTPQRLLTEHPGEVAKLIQAEWINRVALHTNQLRWPLLSVSSTESVFQQIL